MKTRIAVIAACVGAFALAQAGLAASETHRPPEMPPTQGGGEPRAILKPVSAMPDVPKTKIIGAADCRKAGGTVVTKNGVSTCVYPAGLDRRGYGIYIVGS